jgi:3-polyprenyl-4-hydroxybenzoate decarboxylase
MDIVDHTVHRILDLIGLPHPFAPRWKDIVNEQD